jgi:hypothetical protein
VLGGNENLGVQDHNTSHQSNSHPCPTAKTLFPFTFLNRPSMIHRQMTLSCQTLTKKQLAQEMWTCKDPLCHTPHHQTPMGYHFTPSTLMPQDMRPCHQQSSEHSSVTTLVPHQCIEVSPCQLAVPDPSPLYHLTVPHFVVSSSPKGNTKKSLGKGLQKPLIKGPRKSRHLLAEDAAHALLSGASCRSHPYSLKY